MVKWFTLKKKAGGKINLPPFVYFYCMISTPVMPTFVNWF